MRFAMLMIVGLVYSSSLLAEDKPDPRENLDTVIAEMIRLIEAKDTAGMIKTFVSPKDLQRKLENKTIEDLVKELEPRLPLILNMLKQVQGTKPRLNEAGTEATYDLKEQIEGGKEIKFRKIEKLWYIR